MIKKLTCRFVGWNSNLLTQCGEASQRVLKIYTCALLIIMTIWATIGFVFSQRYIGIESIVGRVAVALIFAIVVFMIERIIILHIGKGGIYWFRTFLAVCMAILGAFIFDQMIFRNDLEDAIRIEEKHKIENEINEKISKTQQEITILKVENDSLYIEIAKKPTIHQTSTHARNVPTHIDSNGVQQYKRIVDISVGHIANPAQAQVKENEGRLQRYEQELFNYRNFDIEGEVQNRIKNKKTGFLEELKASLRVIGESWISVVFYCILFAVLLCLELFVVSLKWFKSPCEYELLVKHQLDCKTLQLKYAWDELNKRYVTQTMEKES